MGMFHFRVAGDHISVCTIMANRSEEPLDTKSAWTCLCICVYFYEWEGRSFICQALFFFFSSLKIKTPPQASCSIQVCPREDAGGRGWKKMKHSSTSSLKGNRKRLRDRDSGACFFGTMKISLEQETDMRQRRPTDLCYRATTVTLDGAGMLCTSTAL